MPKQRQRINVSRYQRSRESDEPTNNPARTANQQTPATIRPKRKRVRQSFMAEGVSLEALAGVSVLFPFGYLAVEGIMNDSRHPIHWIIAIAAGVVGFVGGQLLSLWRAGRR